MTIRSANKSENWVRPTPVRKSPRAVSSTAAPPDSPLYGISPLALANLFRLDEKAAVDWKARLRKNPDDAMAVSLFARHDLGAFDARWMGFVLDQGKLWTPENMAVAPEEVCSLPHLYGQLNEYERAQRWQLDHHYEQLTAARRDSEVRTLLKTLTELMRQR